MQFVDQLDSVGQLPTPPGVVARLLEVTQRPDASAHEVAKVVSGDPAMSAKILRFVNSPMAGINREVTSLQQAVALLGMNSVKMMALSFAVISTSTNVRCAGFDSRHFAAFSATCGSAARHLSDRLGIESPSEAFTAGLLSQYGRFVFASLRPETYERVMVLAKCLPRDLPAHEREAFGETYATVGAQLLRRWGLPESLCAVIASFRDDGVTADHAALAPIIALAEEAAVVVCPLLSNHTPDPEPFLKLAGHYYDLSQDDCTDMLMAISDEARQVCAMFDASSASVLSARNVELQVRDRITEIGMALHLENQALSRQQEDLQRRATTDSLTGIGNRAAFDARLGLEMERSGRSRQAFALLMLDVDHFKAFNDNHGHQAGDRVLKVVAAALDNNVRRVDHVARYGGEEFAVIAPDTTPDGVSHLAERLRSVVEASCVQWEGQAFRVTISIGVAVYSELPEKATPESMIGAADQQLYAAKCAGRNVVRIMLNGQPALAASPTV